MRRDEVLLRLDGDPDPGSQSVDPLLDDGNLAVTDPGGCRECRVTSLESCVVGPVLLEEAGLGSDPGTEEIRPGLVGGNLSHSGGDPGVEVGDLDLKVRQGHLREGEVWRVEGQVEFTLKNSPVKVGPEGGLNLRGSFIVGHGGLWRAGISYCGGLNLLLVTENIVTGIVSVGVRFFLQQFSVERFSRHLGSGGEGVVNRG